MKKFSSVFGISVLVLIFFVNGCKKDNAVAPDNSQYNSPAIANTTNSFGFSVDAQAFSYTVNLPLQFKNATILNTGIAITDFKYGNGRVTIYDSTNTILYEQKITGPLAATNQLEVFAQPKKISISFVGFTGKVSMGFNGK